MSKINWKEINSRALNISENVASHWVPDGKRNSNEWVGLNPTRGDNSKGSFSINLITGVWKDFSSNDGGADLISLVAYVEGIGQGKAASTLSKFLGIIKHETVTTNKTPQKKKNTFKALYNPPKTVSSQCPTTHPTLGTPSIFWDYLSSEGILLMRVMRFDNNKSGERKKEFRPLVYGEMGCNKPQWHWRQLPNKRPLYNLNKFDPKQHKITVICEGEKAADAATKLFPDYFVTCWSGGSKAVNKSDYTLLEDQIVIFWPDNDEAGIGAIPLLANELNKVGSKHLSIICSKFFVDFTPIEGGNRTSGGQWPDKADAFEAVEMGWTAQHLNKAIEDKLLFDESEIQEPEIKDIIPYGYKLDDIGIWHLDPKKEDYRRLCGAIEIIALSRSGSGDGRNWGRLVRFKDFDYQEKLWNIPMQSFATVSDHSGVRAPHLSQI